MPSLERNSAYITSFIETSSQLYLNKTEKNYYIPDANTTMNKTLYPPEVYTFRAQESTREKGRRYLGQPGRDYQRKSDLKEDYQMNKRQREGAL